jgi:REP element-mobilizing transposase RayT
MRYRRVRIPGATYFFTVVTYRRLKLLAEPGAVERFQGAVVRVQERHPFRVDAAVVLPDHIHALWTLPMAIPTTRSDGASSRRPSGARGMAVGRFGKTAIGST